MRWFVTGLAMTLASVAFEGDGAPARASTAENRLVTATLEHNSLAIGQLADNLSHSDLQQMLRSEYRVTRIAALVAIPHIRVPWLELPVLTEIAKSASRNDAVRASRAAHIIVTRVELSDLATYEWSEDEVLAMRRAWLQIAGQTGRWPDVRVHAIEVATELARLSPTAPMSTTSLITDGDPEIRRAAIELLPAPLSDDMIGAMATRLEDDPIPSVAVAAAQVLCATNPMRAKAQLSDGGLSRLQTLITDKTLAPWARIVAARCLAADDAKASRQALTKLPTTVPKHLRKIARGVQSQ